MTESDQKLTTSELANQPTDDADAPMARDQDTDGVGAGDAATQETQAEPAVTPLLSGEQTDDFDRRWTEIQAAFVDEPHAAVQNADQLVAELMQTLAASFAETRAGLEQQWTAATTSRPRICESPSRVTARSSSAYWLRRTRRSGRVPGNVPGTRLERTRCGETRRSG